MKNYTVEEYALCTRFKSKRRKKRLVKEDFDRQLIQLHKLEKNFGNSVITCLGSCLMSLIKKDGDCHFKLRDDVVRSSEAEFYKTLLEKINTRQFSSDKTFKKRKSKKRKNASSVQIQRLKEFTESEWNNPKLELSEREKAHFAKQERWSKVF
ncbi:hypothetical protein ACQ9BO_13040 [Flavobacterium sp. P21]|uniref:hypothetical protein n=1 Tax=Flavobacterium sp. P21 TaxID=3423948 RepID=UPI003D665C3A